MQSLVKKITPGFIKTGYKKIRNSKYAGNNVECPVCGLTFTKFLPFGHDQRENAKCVNCGSLERHRLIWKYLQEKEQIFQQQKHLKILHFGPEKMFYDVFSKKSGVEYVPCDLFPEVYPYNGRIKIQKVDITKIPFEENYFDLVLCIHVLEHIPDDRLAMRELYRVMKKDGFGIFQVPIDYNREVTYEDFTITSPEEREKAFGQDDHVRWYGCDYKDRLKSVGFNVKEDDYVESFSAAEKIRYGLTEGEKIYYCKKV